MVLTALFALSFSTETLGLAYEIPHQNYIAPALMLLIGIGIDLSKYVFWSSSSKSFYYLLLSVVLVLFSWTASVAFFSTQNDATLNQERKATASYLALKFELDALDITIAQKRSLILNKTGSKFHDQWEDSERLASELEQLNAKRKDLMAKEAETGLAEAQRKIPSMALFLTLARWLDWHVDTVRNFSYAVLGLIIEVSSLGLISLVPLYKATQKISEDVVLEADGNCGHDVANSVANILLNDEEGDIVEKAGEIETERKIIPRTEEGERLIDDIQFGRIKPVVRHVLDSKCYKLKHSEIKEIFEELKERGVITSAAKNSYRLSVMHHQDRCNINAI